MVIDGTCKGCTFQELGKQTTSSANFQAEHLLSRLIFDSSTFCSACKIVRTQSLFTELLKSVAFRCFLPTFCSKCNGYVLHEFQSRIDSSWVYPLLSSNRVTHKSFGHSLLMKFLFFWSLKYKWASRCLKTWLIKSSKKTRKKNLEMTGLWNLFFVTLPIIYAQG